MVQKIQASMYLKRYDNMTADERQAYDERVGEWLKNEAPLLETKTADFDARLQNVLQVSGGWNDQECRAFEEGAILLSAHVSTGETWLPDMLYIKSAKRTVMRMYDVLSSLLSDKPQRKAKEDPAAGTGKATQDVASFQGKAGSGVRMQAGSAKEEIFTVKPGGATSISVNGKPLPVRPKHVDQYAYLLPQKTQEYAAQLKDLYRGLDDARQKMNLLMDDKAASAADREAWAKKATSIDNKIRKILDELDAEWAKLVKEGRVVVDDLGFTQIVEGPAEEAEPEKQEPTSEQRARRRELRKWLVDTRRGNGDSREEHVKKWKENFQEFLSFDGEAAYDDEKIKAAAEHYGISLLDTRTKETKEL